ncbi:glycosyltransferase [Ligilactobacillus saerimneri]|uniref:glycosyltransferase n=1 Tax=Ligilactobacillus saerimneri TaxID=228229 RepID=UPI0022A702D7|nr:glycosyltransferase [Ligilactobacillus saerimneri]MCZ0891365.1 glycosyltransferase [Ligilactobacillus saerimneri]MDI9206546.1 glycosyltransferase [Ligilactobacillus saerimneri]
MIFVTVGTHEQPFNRLIKKVDELVADGTITEPVVMQTGFSTYVPKHCEWHKMLSYDEMKRCIDEARIVITHGGPASFIEVLQTGKIPVVVPRLAEFDEHVNNHQKEFVRIVEKRMNDIIPVYEINQLSRAIVDYETLMVQRNNTESSNNKRFNIAFEKLINELF